MGSLVAPRLAGTALGARDALHVQMEQQHQSLLGIQRQAHVDQGVGTALQIPGMAIEYRCGDFPPNGLDEISFELRNGGPFPIQVLIGLEKGLLQAHNIVEGFRPGPKAPFLGPTDDPGPQSRILANIGKTDALGPVELMGGSGHKIHGHLLYIPRKMSDGLHGIRMEKGSRSEEHTSELQSRENLVCRLLLEKKKKST